MSDLSFLDEDRTAGLEAEPAAGALAPWSQEDEDAAWDDYRLGRAMLAGYFERNRSDFHRFEVVASERRVIVKNDVSPSTWADAVVIDLVLRDKQDGGIWIMDHKTYDPAGANDARSTILIDSQGISYTRAFRKIYKEEARGVIWNVLWKTAPKKPEALKKGGLSVAKNQHTTSELYRQALREQGLDENAKTGSPQNFPTYADFIRYLDANRREYFTRTTLAYPDYRLARHSAEERILLKRIAALARRVKDDHGKPTAEPVQIPLRNVSRMNCPRCPYYSLCLADSPEARENFKKSDRVTPPVEKDGKTVNMGGRIFELVGFDKRRGLGKRKILSHSRAVSLLSCEQQHEFNYTEGLRPKERAAYLDFGDWIHQALHVWYTSGGDNEAAERKFEGAWDENFQKRYGRKIGAPADALPAKAAAEPVGF